MPQQPLTSSGYDLDLSPESFGELRTSNDLKIVNDFPALRQRMETDGYLYLPGLLNPETVLEVRRIVTDRLAAEDLLDPQYPTLDAISAENVDIKFRPDLTRDNPALQRLLYHGEMLDFFTSLIDGEVRHFDFTWFRAISPGKGTYPHCDIVYMGRGTHRLYTAWVPMGDVPLELGGLMILENSHLQHERLKNYLARDVDSYCTNRPGGEAIASGEKASPWDGALARNPVSLREKLGGRWLTARKYCMGDALIFSMHTVHASLDNQTRAFRFSSDSRYQSASQPADERWIGSDPIGHSVAGKKGRIC